MGLDRIVTVTVEELEASRAQIEREINMSEDELREFGRTHTLTGPEISALSEFDRIAFLLGEPYRERP